MKKTKFSFVMLAVAAILSIAIQGCEYFESKSNGYGGNHTVIVSGGATH